MDIRSDMESLNSRQSCVLMCRCVDVSEERPSRIPRDTYAPEALKRGPQVWSPMRSRRVH